MKSKIKVLVMKYLRQFGFLFLLLLSGIISEAIALDTVSNEYKGPTDKLHVYLLIGDSIMAGHVEYTEKDLEVINRCYLLNTKGEWEKAKVPFNRYSTVIDKKDAQKLGPGLGFVKAMLKKDKDISIGLIVNATKGSLLEDWHMKSKCYRGARGRTKIAKRSGVLKGVLWHHSGESRKTFRLDYMKNLISQIRMDQGLLDLPFVLGEVPNGLAINNLIKSLSSDVHATGVASSIGLTATDSKEMDYPSIFKLGERYADEMIKVQSTLATKISKQPQQHIKITDTHIHAMANKKNGLDSLSQWMNKNNIERTIVHPLTQSRAVSAKERIIMLENYSKYKGKIYRFCIINPEEVSTVEEAVIILKKEKAEGAIGFGEHYGRNLMFDAPSNMRLYAACEKVGLPIMFHMDANKNMDEEGFPHLQKALKAYPKCIFIAHAQWWMQFPSGLCSRMLQDYPNLYAEPSGGRMVTMLNRNRSYTRNFLIQNADKVMFGSDAGWWSIKNKKASELQFSLFEKIELPYSIKLKILKTNAEKVFGFNLDK